MKPVVMMSYKDYKATWDKIVEEANLDEIMKPLGKTATVKEIEDHRKARLMVHISGKIMSIFCLELTGMISEQDRKTWDESEELFDATEMTDRLAAVSIARILGLEMTEDQSQQAIGNSMAMYRSMPKPIFIYWVGQWLDHMNKSFEEIYEDYIEEQEDEIE